jgi:outer membrane protein assembly factor BamB
MGSMKNKKITLVFLFLALTLVLSSCGRTLVASGWPGISGDEDTVYVSYANRIYSLRLKDGSLNWDYPEKIEAARTFFSPAAVDADNLYVGDYKNVFYSFNKKNGVKNWEFTGATNRYIAGAVLAGDLILAPNADYNLYALDLNGILKWKFQSGHALWSAPVVENEIVYLSSMDHYLYALNLNTGEKIWGTDMGGAIVYSPSLEENTLFVGTLANEISAVNKTNGSVIWKVAVADGLWSEPVAKDGVVYYGDALGKVYAVSAQDGSKIWDYNMGEMVSGAPAIMESGIVFTGENGKLVALDYNGELLWNRTVDGKLYTGPVVVDGQLILGIVQGDAVVRTFDFEGNEIWTPFTPSN